MKEVSKTVMKRGCEKQFLELSVRSMSNISVNNDHEILGKGNEKHMHQLLYFRFSPSHDVNKLN